jgi:predicted nucleotidyltransferase/DNA-binding XRE family transcriptional regulator
MDVKQLRKISGMTQKAFCDRYRIPMKTLQNWETDSELSSSRTCPQYVSFLLEKAVMEDFPVVKNLINSNIDDRHLTALKYAKEKISKSSLSKYVKDVILYGSTARGQAEFSSDVDLLMILDDKIKHSKRYNNVIVYLKGNISTDDYSLPEADLHVVFYETWNNNDNVYFSNIREEGFSIWN